MSEKKLWYTDLPDDWRQELFDYMQKEHNVALLDSDMNEIRHIILGEDNYLKETNLKNKSI